MTATLAGAMVLSVLSGVVASWLFLAWPRRLTAEEWVVHRRSFTQPARAARPQVWLRLLSRHAPGSPIGIVIGVSNADLALLEVAGWSVPITGDAVLRRLAWLAAGGAIAGIVLASILAIASGAVWVAFASPLLGVLGAVVVAGLQLVSWRVGARRLRADVQRHLPRLLTGTRVLLESGAATAEGALAATVTTYADPAADLFREALRLKEVRRLELEAALDEVAERYAVGDLHRLADSFRIGHRYGTGMSALLTDYAKAARGSWHARYRERITRAPVLMTVPALLFFVLPLLVLVMYLVFSPLLSTLGRL